MTSTENEKKTRSENPYHDRIEGDILIYTARGRTGDQQLTGRNKRILEQYSSPIPIFGFINHGQQVYEFLGLLEIQRHYPEQQIDKTGILRSVWIFEFKIHKLPVLIRLSDATQITTMLIKPKEPSVKDLEKEVVTTFVPDFATRQELLDVESIRSRLFDVNPYRFEHLIKAVIEKRGFHKVEVTRSSGDGGIDLNAQVKEENEFFNGTFVQIQAKRWRKSVGSIEINNFRGALHSTAKGIFVTTSYYTKAAIENAYNPMKFCVTLIDGHRFALLISQSKLQLSDYL
jgi:HJR/Mrr/RecB family endonuclease